MRHCASPTLALMAAMAMFSVLSLPTAADARGSHRGYGHHGYGHGHRGYGYGHRGYGYGYGHHGYDYGYGYGTGSYARRGCDCGWIRIRTEPAGRRGSARVLVDGAHAGVVDDFDGLLQRLSLSPGAHEIEILLEGHETFRRKIFVSRSHTYDLRHPMEPLPTASSRASDSPSVPSRAVAALQREPAGAEYGAIHFRGLSGCEHAAIFVDGAHAGVVDDFDGAFQRLNLSAGGHEVVVVLDGGPILRGRVLVVPGRTTVIRQGDLASAAPTTTDP